MGQASRLKRERGPDMRAVPRQLSETQQLRCQVLLRDMELMNVRSRDLMAEFRTTLQPAPQETLFDPTTMTFRAPASAPPVPQAAAPVEPPAGARRLRPVAPPVK